MIKIPCLFQRGFFDRKPGQARDEPNFRLLETVTPGCEWVFDPDAGARATRKWDGTACLVRDGILYKRYDAKRDRKSGEFKPPPSGAIPCCEPDPETGHWPHWLPVSADKPEDKWHVAAWESSHGTAVSDDGQGNVETRYYSALGGSAEGSPDRFPTADGTYELCGPHFNGNAERLETDRFIRHGEQGSDHGLMHVLVRLRHSYPPFETIRKSLVDHEMEGIVFHAADGRMCKIRRADYGIPWSKRP